MKAMMSEDDTNDGNDWEDYDSGPYCRHWSDPSDCEITCANCGHHCQRHSIVEPSNCFDCKCNKWVESDE